MALERCPEETQALQLEGLSLQTLRKIRHAIGESRLGGPYPKLGISLGFGMFETGSKRVEIKNAVEIQSGKRVIIYQRGTPLE